MPWATDPTENFNAMFLTKDDLKNNIYGYQLHEITGGNESIVQTALEAAENELRAYLTPNNDRRWLDGRPLYDTDAIFSATGNDRNALLVRHGVVIAKWWIVELSNVDIIYQQAKERYDMTRRWLEDLAAGKVNLDLPLKNPDTRNVFIYGSRKKFNHEL